ncbi:S8 family serine peptidase [Roseisolibacter agri]|uniref:S8 family serine peptidase n=1 Tax=Roseisolibacter agri TaxID=2014610 RepID=UPI0024E0E8E9|nr:S8 family serine peptidase [Roseisolibacter agri]
MRKSAAKRPTAKVVAETVEMAAPPAQAVKAAAAPAAARRAATIVYVHGIGNKPLPSVLKCQWDHALFGFDLGERSRLSYWCNREYYPRAEEGTCKGGDLVTLESEPTGEGLSVRQHLHEVTLAQEAQSIAPDDPEAQRFLERVAATIEASTEVRATEADAAFQERRPLRLQRAQGLDVGARAVEAKILPVPEFVRRWITRQLTRALLRDVHDFFFVPARGAAMRESLRARLRTGGGPFVIVAHSQGSMIAYAVLSEPEFRTLDVALLVTVGSPLGIREVQDQLKKETGLRVPPNVRRWLNVADPLDPVALDKRLSQDYAPSATGVRVEDDVEWNLDSPRHPHSGTGYLRTPPVRMAVRQVVDTALFQPVAEFTMARDMVREMENRPPDIRHEVLIELADPGLTGRPTSVARTEVRRRLEDRARDSQVDFDDMALEELDRFMAAELTRAEAEWLAHQTDVTVLGIKRIWRNAVKRALLDESASTVQASTAHLGYQADGRGIQWAVLDTGVVASHPHLAARNSVVAEYDCTKRGALKEGGTATDGHGHGTHVAGIIAGRHEFRPTDGVPRVFTGIAPAAKLHVYKVLADDGTGRDAWIIKALDHIAEVNRRAGQLVIHGVNLSLGGPFDQSVFGCGHSPLCTELRRLWRQGVVVVLAAGNEGFATLQTLEGPIEANMDLSIGDPANLEDAIAVGSTHKTRPHTYGISYFSSRGPTADGRQKPDLVAPGERVRSCRHDWVKGNGGNGAAGTPSAEDLYVEMSGTSMAAPHVSGILASFLSARREFIGEPDRLKALLLASCTDLQRHRPQQGAGLPNLTKMLLNT